MRPEITAENEYITPEDTPHILIDRLTFNTRFIFTALFLKTVFKSRSQARKGLYDTRHWIDSSHDIYRKIIANVYKGFKSFGVIRNRV